MSGQANNHDPHKDVYIQGFQINYIVANAIGQWRNWELDVEEDLDDFVDRSREYIMNKRIPVLIFKLPCDENGWTPAVIIVTRVFVGSPDNPVPRDPPGPTWDDRNLFLDFLAGTHLASDMGDWCRAWIKREAYDELEWMTFDEMEDLIKAQSSIAINYKL